MKKTKNILDKNKKTDWFTGMITVDVSDKVIERIGELYFQPIIYPFGTLDEYRPIQNGTLDEYRPIQCRPIQNSVEILLSKKQEKIVMPFIHELAKYSKRNMHINSHMTLKSRSSSVNVDITNYSTSSKGVIYIRVCPRNLYCNIDNNGSYRFSN